MISCVRYCGDTVITAMVRVGGHAAPAAPPMWMMLPLILTFFYFIPRLLGTMVSPWQRWIACAGVLVYLDRGVRLNGFRAIFPKSADVLSSKALGEFQAEVLPVVRIVITEGLQTFVLFSVFLASYCEGSLVDHFFWCFVFHCLMSTLRVLQLFMFQGLSHHIRDITGEASKPIKSRLQTLSCVIYHILFLPCFIYGYNDTGRLNVVNNWHYIFMLCFYCAYATNGDAWVFLPAIGARWSGVPLLCWCVMFFTNMRSLSISVCKHCGAMKPRDTFVRCKHCGACYCNDACAKKDRPNHTCYQTGLRGNRQKTDKQKTNKKKSRHDKGTWGTRG